MAGLNNSGQVALGFNNAYDRDFFNNDDPPTSWSTNPPCGNSINTGTAIWTVGSGCVPRGAVPNLLNDSYTDALGHTYLDSSFAPRWNIPTGINDYGDVIGIAGEVGSGPPWYATNAVENSASVGDVIYLQPTSGNVCVKGGRLFSLMAINNSGTLIGYYQDYQGTPDAYGPITPIDLRAFYGSGSSPTPLEGTPQAINDNGDILGSDDVGTVVWFHSTDKKMLDYTGAPLAYLNNNLESPNAWYHGRARNLPDLVSAPGWGLSGTGVAISHDSGIILADASTNGVTHVVELVPCRFSLLNGSTNQADVDGKDFTGYRPTTISATTPYATAGVVSLCIGGTGASAGGNAGVDHLGADIPLGTGRNLPSALTGNCDTYSLMMLAKVAPASSGITYGWNRVYQGRDVTISQTSTNTWYVKGVRFHTGYPTPQPDSPNPPGTDKTIVPSTNNNVVVFYDNPAMFISPFLTNNPAIGDYAYHKRDFTYSLTNSIGSASAIPIPSQQVGYIAVARRINTNNVVATDWTNVINMASTTNIPDCSGVTTSEIRAIVGGTNTIIFDQNVTNNY